MKNVLITGANSYIGVSVEQWLKRFPNDYKITTLDLLKPDWYKHNFQEYEVVFHVAGIVHKKETAENKSQYYEVNYKLALEVAKKAKDEGVNQFIILSSMSVYGLNQGRITKETVPNPKTSYAKSKWLADQELEKMQSYNFKIAILRPPMVYGENCKGNYPILRKLALKSPIFPDIENERSMIYIDNLSAFIKGVIDNQLSGTFHPQNEDYVSTVKMVKEICAINKKKIYCVKIFNPFIRILKVKAKLLQKVFGTLIYEKCDLCGTVAFCESIIKTETEENINGR